MKWWGKRERNKIRWTIFFFLLTSCNQYNFRHWGLATAKHSKYTSSPSLMLSDNVDPRRNVTIGGSANGKHLLFLLHTKLFFISYPIPFGDFLSSFFSCFLMNHHHRTASATSLQASFAIIIYEDELNDNKKMKWNSMSNYERATKSS